MKKNKTNFILSSFICFICVPFSHAQQHKTSGEPSRTIDSLRHQLQTFHPKGGHQQGENLKPQTTNRDTDLVNTLNALGFALYTSNPDSTILLAEQAATLAKKINMPDGSHGFKKGEANANRNAGIGYWAKGDYHKALDYYFRTLKMCEELGLKKGIATTLSTIGTVYDEQADYPKALDYYFRALKMKEELGDKNGIAIVLGNIGIVYREQADYPKALDYYFRALKMKEELGDKRGIAKVLGNIGNVYNEQADYPKALDYYFRALTMDEELGDKRGIARNLGNIGGVYHNQADYPKALDYFFRALKMAEELGSKDGIGIVLGNIGLLYTRIGKFAAAEDYLKKSIALDSAIGAQNDLRQGEEMLSALYDTTGRHKLALIHYKKSITLKDTIFSQENKKQLIRKEMNYTFEKKEAAAKAEQDKKDAVAAAERNKEKIIRYSVIGGLALMFIVALVIFRALRITNKQKKIIETARDEIAQQKKLVDDKNKDITDSINYAVRIQKAMLKEEEHVSAHLPEHFIILKPKDIVSGDFYWALEKHGHWYLAAVDCTGHGVPGAFMSMLGMAFLNEIIASAEFITPAKILDQLKQKVITELRQTGKTDDTKDGMDISLLRLNLQTKQLHWAGANNSLNIIQNGELREIKPDKQPIGYYPQSKPFTNHQLDLQQGDGVYIFSDGYADQFGGSKGKKFKYKQLEQLVLANHHLPMKEQKQILNTTFDDWKGKLEQVDDVLVMGMRV